MINTWTSAPVNLEVISFVFTETKSVMLLIADDHDYNQCTMSGLTNIFDFLTLM